MVIPIEFGRFSGDEISALSQSSPRRLTDRDQRDSVGSGGESAEILAGLVIAREVEIFAGLMAENGFRRGRGLGQRGMNTAKKQKAKKYRSSFHNVADNNCGVRECKRVG